MPDREKAVVAAVDVLTAASDAHLESLIHNPQP
jgi:hypothetical protein